VTQFSHTSSLVAPSLSCSQCRSYHNDPPVPKLKNLLPCYNCLCYSRLHLILCILCTTFNYVTVIYARSLVRTWQVSIYVTSSDCVRAGRPQNGVTTRMSRHWTPLLCHLYWGHRIHTLGGNDSTQQFPLAAGIHARTRSLCPKSASPKRGSLFGTFVWTEPQVAWCDTKCADGALTLAGWEVRTCGFDGCNYCGRLAVAITGGQ
jgi:hypothetical protein